MEGTVNVTQTKSILNSISLYVVIKITPGYFNITQLEGKYNGGKVGVDRASSFNCLQ